MKIIVALTKLALGVMYLAVLSAFFLPALGDYLGHLLIVASAILAIHLVEYFMVRHRMRKVAGDRPRDLLGVLLFGFAHWWPIIRGAGSAKASGCE